MDDSISRQAAIDAVKDAVIKDEQQYVEDALKALPPVQTEIIHCKGLPLQENLFMEKPGRNVLQFWKER